MRCVRPSLPWEWREEVKRQSWNRDPVGVNLTNPTTKRIEELVTCFCEGQLCFFTVPPHTQGCVHVLWKQLKYCRQQGHHHFVALGTLLTKANCVLGPLLWPYLRAGTDHLPYHLNDMISFEIFPFLASFREKYLNLFYLISCFSTFYMFGDKKIK